MSKLGLPALLRRCALALLPIGLLVAGGAQAETQQAEGPTALRALVAEAQAGGNKVVVIEAPAGGLAAPQVEQGPALGPGLGSVIHDRALEVRDHLRDILAGAADFASHAGATIQAQSGDGDSLWPLFALFTAALFLLAGTAVEWPYRRWAAARFESLFAAPPRSRAEKIGYLLLRATSQYVGVKVQMTVALLLAVVFDAGEAHLGTTHFIVFGVVGALRLAHIFFENLLASATPAYRVLAIGDGDAVTLQRGLLVLLSVVALAGGLCLWMERLALDWHAHLLALIGTMAVSTLLILVFSFWQRRVVARMIVGLGDPQTKPLLLRFLASSWHLLAGLYFLAAWAVASVRLVLELPYALGLVTGPVLIVFLAVAGYGVALLLIDWAFDRRRDTDEPKDADDARSFKGLAREAAGFIILALGLWSIVDIWGIDLVVEGGMLHRLWEVLLVGFLAYLAFQGVKIVIDRKIEEEGGDAAPLPGEEGAGAGSRLATLLPLFRNFLFIVIAVIAGMIALSELGVDIAPLFAGAGVIGLAIGFGAQTLIRDIFSGAFFLMDDAFRKGEYIDIGTVKGTVERISLRSLQLRHHMGPLHTIPFGEITRLTNYSRDWVMMKLPLRVTYDTDVEKVRKLIKKLGQELLEHPEEGPKFLEPLKSQGVYRMEDSAMIIRVKYMTRPGDQFTTRKLVYAKIRELFEREGIHFAHREVTVRVAETPNGRPLSAADKEALAGAVTPLPDPETGLAKAAG